MTVTGERADATIVFTPSGRRGRVPVGTTVLDAARRLGVDLDSVCNGRALCGRCMVTPANGSFSKHAITSLPSTSTLDGSAPLLLGGLFLVLTGALLIRSRMAFPTER